MGRAAVFPYFYRIVRTSRMEAGVCCVKGSLFLSYILTKLLELDRGFVSKMKDLPAILYPRAE